MLIGYEYDGNKKIKWCITKNDIFFSLNDISRSIGRSTSGLGHVVRDVDKSKLVYRGSEGVYVREKHLQKVKKYLETKDKYEYNLFVNEVMPLVLKIKEREFTMNNFKKYTFQDVNDVTQMIKYLCTGDKIWFDSVSFMEIVGMDCKPSLLSSMGVLVRKTKNSMLISKQSIIQMDHLIASGKISASQWDNKDVILHLVGNACESKKPNKVAETKSNEDPTESKSYYILERDIPSSKIKNLEGKGYKYASISAPPFGHIPVMYNKQNRETIRGVQKLLEVRLNCKSKIKEIEGWVLSQLKDKNDISNDDVNFIAKSMGCTPFKFYQFIQEFGYTKNKDKVWTIKQSNPITEPMFLPEPQPETKTIRYKELVSSKGWWLFKSEIWEVKEIKVPESEVDSFKGTIKNKCEILEII